MNTRSLHSCISFQESHLLSTFPSASPSPQPRLFCNANSCVFLSFSFSFLFFFCILLLSELTNANDLCVCVCMRVNVIKGRDAKEEGVGGNIVSCPSLRFAAVPQLSPLQKLLTFAEVSLPAPRDPPATTRTTCSNNYNNNNSDRPDLTLNNERCR